MIQLVQYGQYLVLIHPTNGQLFTRHLYERGRKRFYFMDRHNKRTVDADEGIFRQLFFKITDGLVGDNVLSSGFYTYVVF